METGVTPNPPAPARRRPDPVLVGLFVGLGGVFAMCAWAGLFWGLLHTLFHGPILSGAVSVRYGPAATFDLPVSVETIASVAAFVLPLVLAVMVATNRPRMPWWAWLGLALFVGSLLAGLVIALNPNWYGVELGASVQGGWLWACGCGFLLRRLLWAVRRG